MLSPKGVVVLPTTVKGDNMSLSNSDTEERNVIFTPIPLNKTKTYMNDSTYVTKVFFVVK